MCYYSWNTGPLGASQTPWCNEVRNGNWLSLQDVNRSKSHTTALIGDVYDGDPLLVLGVKNPWYRNIKFLKEAFCWNLPLDNKGRIRSLQVAHFIQLMWFIEGAFRPWSGNQSDTCWKASGFMLQSFDRVPVPVGDVFGTESLTISIWSLQNLTSSSTLSFNGYAPGTLVRISSILWDWPPQCKVGCGERVETPCETRTTTKSRRWSNAEIEDYLMETICFVSCWCISSKSYCFLFVASESNS